MRFLSRNVWYILKMKKIISILFLATCLAACSELGPFIDARREAGKVKTVGQSQPNRIAVCYNPVWDSDEAVLALATEGCAKQKKKPVFSEKKYFNCRLVAPNTAFYDCK